MPVPVESQKWVKKILSGTAFVHETFKMAGIPHAEECEEIIHFMKRLAF